VQPADAAVARDHFSPLQKWEGREDREELEDTRIRDPAIPEKVVPITREESRYLEPVPHAVKRKNGEGGSCNGPAC
jgi:hypothetical protein